MGRPGDVPRYGLVVQPGPTGVTDGRACESVGRGLSRPQRRSARGLLRWPKSTLFGRRLSRPQDRQVRGLLDVRLRRVVRVGVVRPDELHDLDLIDALELE